MYDVRVSMLLFVLYFSLVLFLNVLSRVILDYLPGDSKGFYHCLVFKTVLMIMVTIQFAFNT